MKKFTILAVVLAMLCVFALTGCSSKKTAACEHDFELTKTVAATCTEDGSETYTCSECQETKKETIEKTGHDYKETIIDATCAAAGEKTITCENCGDSTTEMLPILEHSYGQPVVTAATCAVQGKKVTTCSVCGDEIVETLAKTSHSYTSKVTKAATCSATGVLTYTCSVCDESYTETIAKVKHKYDEKITKPATCAEEGVKTFTCTVCAHVETASVAKVAHTYAVAATVPATCLTNGSTTYTCTVCGNSYSESIAALGHDYQTVVTTKPTCEAEGVETTSCTRCGDSFTKAVAALGHVYAGVPTTPATCAEPGVMTYTCTGCDSSYTEEIAQMEHKLEAATCTSPAICLGCGESEGEALGHNYTSKVTKNVTCAEEGETTFTCGRCADTYTEAIEKLPHTFKDATCADPMTCTACGATEGEALGHTWVDATCTTAKTCSVCQATEGEALGHTWAEASCTTAKTCSVCNTVDGNIPGHQYVSVDTVPATCSAPGLRTHTCSVCGDSYTEELAQMAHKLEAATCTSPAICLGCGESEGEALGHNYTSKVTKNATCAEEGETTFTCGRCADTYTEAIEKLPHTFKDATCADPMTCTACGATEGEALGHTWVDATCTTAKTCSVCQATEGEALGHTWVDASCTAAKTCSVCNFVDGKIPGHQYVSVDTVPATCSAPGLRTHTCSVCDDSYTEELAQMDHKLEAATCTSPAICLGCGESEGEALGHKYTSKVTKKATCAEEGETTFTCSKCKDVYTEAIEKLPHTFKNATCDKPMTCSKCAATEGEALGHTFKDATCTAPKICSVCKATEGEALGHDWTEATCAAPKTCKVCNKTEGKALAHNYKDADCANPKTCVDCGATTGGTTSHNYVDNYCTGCGALDPKVQEIHDSLSKIRRYASYLKIQAGLIETAAELVKLNPSTKNVLNLQEYVHEAADYVSKIEAECSKHTRLYPVTSACDSAEMPLYEGVARTYRIKCETYATRCERVVSAYNWYAENYGVEPVK